MIMIQKWGGGSNTLTKIEENLVEGFKLFKRLMAKMRCCGQSPSNGSPALRVGARKWMIAQVRTALASTINKTRYLWIDSAKEVGLNRRLVQTILLLHD